MGHAKLLERSRALWSQWFPTAPAVAAFAPGRVEILGNHTDYNEGRTLSAALDAGTVFLAAPSGTNACRVVAGNLGQAFTFEAACAPVPGSPLWSLFVQGVWAQIPGLDPSCGFHALFLGDIPMGAGLSSSASLEMAAGLALSALCGVRIDKRDLARAGQTAEHTFVGARCGLMDQLTSLYGRRHELVQIDHRTLAVHTIPLPPDVRFLICDTGVEHSLVASAYNERRARCEEATACFKSALDRPIEALRDVSEADWDALAPRMDPVAARRAAHILGENRRVERGGALLEQGDVQGFGQLMFESHASSQENFENSCPELDVIVAMARALPGLLGARLSGGGFGGSAVLLTRAFDAESAGRALEAAYAKEVGRPCAILPTEAAAGATVLPC